MDQKLSFSVREIFLENGWKVFVVGLFHAEFLKEERAQMNSFNFSDSEIYGNESWEASREETDSLDAQKHPA